VDHLSVVPGKEMETIGHAVRAYRELGIRAYIAPLVGDLEMTDCFPACAGAPERSYTPQGTDAILAWMEKAIEQFHAPAEGINMMVGPTGIQLASDELIKGSVALSEKYGLARHIHCLETKAQEVLARQKYGCSAVRHLADIGYLSPRTSCAHSIHLTDDDIELMREHGATAVHNALSNIRLGSGIAPVLKYRAAGVNVSYGCDGAASNDGQDMLEAIKIGTFLHNLTDADYRKWITPRQAVVMASRGGAQGVGAADLFGTLAPGYDADLVLYDLGNNLSQLPRTEPLGLLIMGRPVDVVHSAWVRGRRVIDNHQANGVDVDALKKKLIEFSEWQFTVRESPTRQLIEADFRKVMGLPE
jgi:5-methylthioadenosine/S-adenosylhomocysteine deaminase